MKTGHPSTRAVNSASGNWALLGYNDDDKNSAIIIKEMKHVKKTGSLTKIKSKIHEF